MIIYFSLFNLTMQHDDKNEDEYWEKKLPDEYQRYVKMADIPLNYTTKKELYLLFCHGFLAYHHGHLVMLYIFFVWF
jgi:hypothetical protein